MITTRILKYTFYVKWLTLDCDDHKSKYSVVCERRIDYIRLFNFCNVSLRNQNAHITQKCFCIDLLTILLIDSRSSKKPSMEYARVYCGIRSRFGRYWHKEVTEADQAVYAGQMEDIQHWEPVIAGRRYLQPLPISEAPPSLRRLERMPSRVDRQQWSLPRHA